MLIGSGWIVLALLLAIGGALLRRRWFGDWDRPRIGAVDMLFSAKGVVSLLLFGLFHLLWFMVTGVPLIMGLITLFS